MLGVCDGMMELPVMKAMPVRRYGLDTDLQIIDAQPDMNDWLLYVNYFGVCHRSAWKECFMFLTGHAVSKRCPRHRRAERGLA